MAPLAEAFVRIRPQLDTFEKETKDGVNKAGRGIAKEGDRHGKVFGATFARSSAGPLRGIAGVFSKSLAGAFAGVAAVAGIGKAVGGIKGAVSAASDLNETISKSATVFGPAQGIITKFANTSAKAFGQSKNEAIGAASQFGNMFNQLGIGQKPAAQMSVQMVKLASDFASFHNADITEVLEAQQAAFRGEFDSVQKFVPTINAAAVEQEGLRLKLASSTKDLTAQDKAIAVHSLLVRGAGKATGDFARTQDSAANQARIAAATARDNAAAFGQLLLPAYTAVLKVVNTQLNPSITALISGLKGTRTEGKGLIGIASTLGLGIRAMALAFKEGDVTSTGFVGVMERVGVTARRFADFVRNEIIPAVREFAATWLPRLRAVLVALGTFIVGVVIPAFASLVGFFVRHTGLLKALAVAIGAVVVVTKLHTAAMAVQAAGGILAFIGNYLKTVKLVQVATKVWTAFQWLLNVALNANPIGLIIIAIAGLVAGIILAYRHSETFRKIVDGAFKLALKVISGVFNFVKSNWPLLLTILGGPIGAFAVVVIKNFGTVKRIVGDVFKFMANSFLGTVSLMLGLLSRLVGAFAKLPGPLGKPFQAAKAAIDKANDSVKALQARINATKGKTVVVTVRQQMANKLVIAAQKGVSLTLTGKPIPLATGGQVRGPGGPTGDKIPAMLSDGEYVVKAAAAKRLGPGFLDLLNRAGDIGGDIGNMLLSLGSRPLRLATGGIVRAQQFVRANANDPYIWGGVGPHGFDCSGLTGAVYAILRGANPYRRYFTTASNFRALGFRPGTGAYTIGVNPGTHMAGNVGGLPFEAASSRSGIHVGRGAKSVLSFARKYFLASLGGVFGGLGTVELGPSELRKIMAAVRINWGVRAGVPLTSFDRGGLLQPGLTLAYNGTGRPEPVGAGNTYVTLNVSTHPAQHPAEIGRQLAEYVSAYGRAGGKMQVKIV